MATCCTQNDSEKRERGRQRKTEKDNIMHVSPFLRLSNHVSSRTVWFLSNTLLFFSSLSLPTATENRLHVFSFFALPIVILISLRIECFLSHIAYEKKRNNDVDLTHDESISDRCCPLDIQTSEGID